MTNTNLIIALIFAGLFGAALILLALWGIHSYINQRCLDLEHCFHFPSTCRSRPSPFVYVEKVEHRSQSRHRSRSRKGERGRRSERSQTRKNYAGQNHGFDQIRDVGSARPMMPFYAPLQAQETYGRQCYPSLGWEEQAQNLQPMMQQQVPMPWRAQGAVQMPPLAMPATVPPQPLHHAKTQMPGYAQHPPQHLPRGKAQSRRPYAETSHSDAPKADQQEGSCIEAESPTKRERRVDRVDYIHICDEYPPIVLEALKKAAPPSPSSSTSSSSSDTTTSTQEVPRTTIPRATPGFAETLPFQFPQYPHVATRAWNTPRSYPRQWMGNNPEGDGLDAKVRYAPFTPVSDHGGKKGSALSNAQFVLLPICSLMAVLTNEYVC